MPTSSSQTAKLAADWGLPADFLLRLGRPVGGESLGYSALRIDTWNPQSVLAAMSADEATDIPADSWVDVRADKGAHLPKWRLSGKKRNAPGRPANPLGVQNVMPWLQWVQQAGPYEAGCVLVVEGASDWVAASWVLREMPSVLVLGALGVGRLSDTARAARSLVLDPYVQITVNADSDPAGVRALRDVVLNDPPCVSAFTWAEPGTDLRDHLPAWGDNPLWLGCLAAGYFDGDPQALEVTWERAGVDCP